MKQLDQAHEQHGWLPEHVLAEVGRQLGVGAASAADHYRYHLAARAAEDPWRLEPTATATAADAADFPDAHRRLSAAGEAPPYPLMCHALWRDPSRALTPLRVAERRRRQTLAETATCSTCEAASNQEDVQ